VTDISEPDLTLRQQELVEALVRAWEASSHTPFDLGSDACKHPNWPPEICAPNREEVRALKHRGLLDADESAPVVWRVFPSAAGRELAGPAAEGALTDPDRRLGLILEATVTAFEADPSEALQFHPKEEADLVRHEHWSLQPEVVRAHDLHQLKDLGLIATSAAGRTMTFWPTIRGRAAADPRAHGLVIGVRLTTRKRIGRLLCAIPSMDP